MPSNNNKYTHTHPPHTPSKCASLSLFLSLSLALSLSLSSLSLSLSLSLARSLSLSLSLSLSFKSFQSNQFVKVVFLKGALDNIFKFSFWPNFIYQVKSGLLVCNYKKKNSKIPSKSEEIINVCKACIKWG